MSERIIKGLPPSFHQSFPPERRHLASLLAAATQGFAGTAEAISERTAIPTGKSSGKVVPHLKYLQCMGLLESANATAGMYKLSPTLLGQVVFVEDPLLQEPLTQLVLHLMLAQPLGGASVWHMLFGRSRIALGGRFSSDEAIAFLAQEFGNSSSIPGPLFTTYRESSSLAITGMLAGDKNQLTRGYLPYLEEHFWGYAYCWMHSWEQVAPNDQQIPSAQLEVQTAFADLTAWTHQKFDGFLSWAVDQRILRVDRQTGSPLLMKTVSSAELVSKIYSDIL